jgi:hypothetical protein
MAGFDSSGNFTRLYSWMADATAGTKIRADRHDDEDNGFANGLSQCILKTGVSVIAADIPWNARKITNLGNGIDPGDAVNLSQLNSLKTFSTGLILNGTDANGKLTFGGAGAYAGLAWSPTSDLFFGVEHTGPQWVWNDKADNSGNDIMTLTKGGALVVGNPTGRPALTLTSLKKPSTTNDAGILYFNGYDSGSTLTTFAYMHGTFNDLTAGSEDASLNFALIKAGAMYGALTLTSTTMTTPGDASVGGNLTVSGTVIGGAGGNLYLRPNGVGSGTWQAHFDGATGGLNGINFNPAANATLGVYANHRCKNGVSIAGGSYGSNWFNMLWDGTKMILFVDNTNLGQIGASSDYRIKKDVADLPSTWDRVKALRPISYTQAEFTPPMSEETANAQSDAPETSEVKPPIFAADDIERWGFIAHELQDTLLGTAASGHKDMEDGVQGLNWGPIVAALTKALQEAMARIEALENRP